MSRTLRPVSVPVIFAGDLGAGLTGCFHVRRAATSSHPDDRAVDVKPSETIAQDRIT